MPERDAAKEKTTPLVSSMGIPCRRLHAGMSGVDTERTMEQWRMPPPISMEGLKEIECFRVDPGVE